MVIQYFRVPNQCPLLVPCLGNKKCANTPKKKPNNNNRPLPIACPFWFDLASK